MKENKITYTDYIEIINEIENIELIVTPPKYRKCCHNLLEMMKEIFICLKNMKNLNNRNE